MAAPVTARVEYLAVPLVAADASGGVDRDALAAALNDHASAGWRVVGVGRGVVVMERGATAPVVRRDPALCLCGHWKGAHATDGHCELTTCRCARFRSAVRP